MRDLSRNVPFFIYFERYYGKRKQFCVLTKTWTIVKPNPTRNEDSNSTPKQPLAKSLPTNPSHSKDKTALDIVVQKLGELAKKPAVPLPKSPSQLKVIKLRTTSSSSSSDTEKESLKAKKARQKLERPERHANKVRQPITKDHKEARPNKPQKCYGCGKRGHYKKSCETKTSNLKVGNPEPQEPSTAQPLVQETSNPRTKTQQPKVDLEPIYDKPIQPKKEVKIDDLQRETKETRNEIGALKQNLQALQNTQSLESTSCQSNEEGPSDNKVNQIVDPKTDHIQEPSIYKKKKKLV